MIDFVEKIDGSTWRLKVLVQPGATINKLSGVHAQRIRVRVQAPPVDNKANKFLCSYLARILGIRKNQIRIEKGLTSREKSLIVSGVDEATWKRIVTDPAHQ